jgi:transcriptional regulator with XRE-family HTH domain
MQLTEGESLLICRRRERLSQKQAAIVLMLDRYRYGKFERGQICFDLKELAQPENIKDHERCLVFRKRAGLTQSEVASSLGQSRYWINQKEMGRVDCTDLLEFWEQRQCQK